jgi:hypothetical protein
MRLLTSENGDEADDNNNGDHRALGNLYASRA